MEEAPHYDLGNEIEPRKAAVAFDKPAKGTSVEMFREMILNHLKVREVSISATEVWIKNLGIVP